MSGAPSRRFIIEAARLPCTGSSVFEFPASARSAETEGTHAVGLLLWNAAVVISILTGRSRNGVRLLPEWHLRVRAANGQCFYFFSLVFFFNCFCFCFFCIPGTQTPRTRDRNYVNVAHKEIMCDRNAWDWPVGEWKKEVVCVCGGVFRGLKSGFI